MSDEAEIDALLEREPRNIEALVRKGELRASGGDDRAAAAFYKAALRAAAAAQPLPVSLRATIERAQAGAAQCQASFERHTEAALAAAGFPAGRRPARFQESIDLMRGLRQTELQLQQPTSYYFPGLPQRRYYERSELPWAAQIEAATPAIKAELLDYLAGGGDAFSPYMVADPTRPRTEYHGLVDNPAWSTLYIFSKGRRVPEMERLFPQTLAAVEQLDVPRIGVRAPSILFSRLAPGARIPPHHGVMNARLICHLPLIVPPGCGFRVGGEVREWREGELLVFDDTVEHEAWNDSASDRIILIFDVWRPEVTPDERRAITALFQVVDSYDG
ncbi:MAG TPA: aspartyl/asparaginyl beta-hydroxylase domain-containing protein [Sphingomicrobium sp.]|nr:aspartyl/asparaginyl beta-hydroxylase domain-containing protein [Sphingomicrobium sp.]